MSTRRRLALFYALNISVLAFCALLHFNTNKVWRGILGEVLMIAIITNILYFMFLENKGDIDE